MPSLTDKQAEVILAGCGAPKRGMGWYHAVQLLKGKCPSAVLCYVVEPWFLGGGTFTINCFMSEFSVLVGMSSRDLGACKKITGAVAGRCILKPAACTGDQGIVLQRKRTPCRTPIAICNYGFA